jgi:hypothetical protein
LHNNRPKTAETSAIRVSWKTAKTVSRHAEVQISGRFGSNPTVFVTQRRETGRTNPGSNAKTDELTMNNLSVTPGGIY